MLAVDKGHILSQFILNADHPTDLAPFLDGVARDAGIDILEITDDKEIILYRANQPARRGDRAKTWGVFEALAGSSQLVTSVDARNIAIRAIEPLRVSGKIVGSLSAGVLINDDFIKSLSRDVRADVALLTRSGGVINTSAALAANLDQKAIDSAFERKIPIYTEQISTHHTVVFWPLLIVDQAYVVAIQLDSSSSFQLLERGSRLSASYAGLMLITVLFIGIFILQYLLTPLRQLREKAKKIAIEVTGAAVSSNNSDEIVGVVHVLETLTDRLVAQNMEMAKTAKQLTEAKWAAEAADRAKSEFLATMSHEIRTPLNGVLGMAELLSSTSLNDQQNDFINTICECGNVLLAILNDILDFSQIEANRLEFENSDFELVDLVEFCAEAASCQARGKNIKLATFLDPSISGIYRGDYRRISQILLNLLANAVKFTERGSVVVEVVPVEGGAIEFSVTDTGIGIERGEINKLFERFSQVDASNTRCFGGSGLGLAISRRLTEMMGGEIGVESEPSQGSRFYFRLALQLIGPGRYGIPPDFATAGARCLLVDGDSLLRDVTGRQLAARGLEVDTVTNGDEAVDALMFSQAAGRPFDLAMIAYDALEDFGQVAPALLQAVPGFANIPIILLFASSTNPPIAPTGQVEWFTRPLRHSLLIETLKRIIPNRKGWSPEARSVSLTGNISVPKRSLRVLVAEDSSVNR